MPVMGNNQFPPIHASIETLRFYRGVRESFLTIYLPNGDSYDLTVPQAMLYLERMGLDNIQAQDVLNYVWNFYTVHLDLPTGRYIWIPPEELSRGNPLPIL